MYFSDLEEYKRKLLKDYLVKVPYTKPSDISKELQELKEEFELTYNGRASASPSPRKKRKKTVPSKDVLRTLEGLL